MGYFIDNMMDADKIKYKERSICAINGIRQLISDIQLILSCNTIKGKYYQIAQYIGLATENEKSYYNYFIPINSDIVFLLRFSDHNNTNPSLYNQHERNGRPNKRFIIPFVGNIFQNSGPTPFLGAEHHVVSYPVNALDDEASIKLFLSDLQRLFTNGETNFTQLPQQPIQENNNKQINTNKNIMKINESQLRKIIKESIKNVLNEGFRTLKPYSQEWKDTFGNPEYEDFEDWETDADKYNTYYQYDKNLPTKLDVNVSDEFIDTRITPTRKEFDRYAKDRDNRERLKPMDNEKAWSEFQKNQPKMRNWEKYRFPDENTNVDNDSSSYFRKKYINGD